MIYEFDQFRVDADGRGLSSSGGQSIDLPASALAVLVCLLERAGQPLGIGELLHCAWPGGDGDERRLEQTIARLRAALGDADRTPRFIATVPGGYAFVGELAAPVSAAAPQPTSPNDAPITVAWLLFAVGAFLVLAFIALWAARLSPYG